MSVEVHLSIYSEIFNHKLEPTVIVADFPLKLTVQGMGKLFDSGINAIMYLNSVLFQKNYLILKLKIVVGYIT